MKSFDLYLFDYLRTECTYFVTCVKIVNRNKIIVVDFSIVDVSSFHNLIFICILIYTFIDHISLS